MEEDIYKKTIFKLLQTCRHHKYSMNLQIQETGVYESQHRLLMHLSEHPDYTQKELAEDMHISPATVAVTLKKLERGGYVSRQMDALDNRCNRLVLTERGKEVVEASYSIFWRLDRMTLEGFTEAEIAQFCSYLDRIYDNLDKADRLHFVEDCERREKQ